jgi:hypothetical protein
MRNIRQIVELFSRQRAQTVSQRNSGGIFIRAGTLIPAAQPRTQLRREEMLNRLMDSRRVSPFKHLEHLAYGYQSPDLTQFIGKTATLGKVLFITLLQLRICEIHKSLSKIFRRVAYPVEPFGFTFVQDSLPPSLPGGMRDRFGKRPSLPDQLNEGQANLFQCVHGPISTLPVRPAWVSQVARRFPRRARALRRRAG